MLALQTFGLPEIKEHDPAAVVAQLEANAFLIPGLDVGCLLADGEVASRTCCITGLSGVCCPWK
jgi:hypothetical protein